MDGALIITSRDRCHEFTLEKRDGKLIVRVEDAMTRTHGVGTGETITLRLEPEDFISMGNWVSENF